MVADRPQLQALTAFPASEEALRKRLANASIEALEFAHKIKRCSLTRCNGMCCYDGASLDPAMADTLQEVANRNRSSLTSMGLDLPDAVIEQTTWDGVPGIKTAVRPFPFRSRVKDYPAHFDNTACIFLLEDGRCALQVLSTQQGKHPWFYKPFTCWLHPIKLTDASIRLYDEQSDPNQFPNYDGFASRTCCGRTNAAGSSAVDILREELAFLGKLIERDLIAELESESHIEKPDLHKG